MKKLIETLVQQIVDEPDSVHIREYRKREGIEYHVTVAPNDVGKIIGKRGRIATAIRTVAANETYLGPKVSELIIKEYLQRIPDETSLVYENLSSREKEVLQLIASGKNTKEIAFTFNVSVKTIENQRATIMKKLNLYSIAELTKYAVREGLSSLK